MNRPDILSPCYLICATLFDRLVEKLPDYQVGLIDNPRPDADVFDSTTYSHLGFPRIAELYFNVEETKSEWGYPYGQNIPHSAYFDKPSHRNGTLMSRWYNFNPDFGIVAGDMSDIQEKVRTYGNDYYLIHVDAPEIYTIEWFGNYIPSATAQQKKYYNCTTHESCRASTAGDAESDGYGGVKTPVSQLVTPTAEWNANEVPIIDTIADVAKPLLHNVCKSQWFKSILIEYRGKILTHMALHYNELRDNNSVHYDMVKAMLYGRYKIIKKNPFVYKHVPGTVDDEFYRDIDKKRYKIKSTDALYKQLQRNEERIKKKYNIAPTLLDNLLYYTGIVCIKDSFPVTIVPYSFEDYGND